MNPITRDFSFPLRISSSSNTTRLSSSFLNDIKILFNFEMDSRDLAVVLLVGQSVLNNALNMKNNEAPKQRIITSYNIGNMSIEEFAVTKQYEQGAVSVYQNLQTTITTDIITLEILTHTPIITNTTTDITLDNQTQLTKRQRLKENKRIEADIKKSIEDEDKRIKQLKRLEKK